MIEKTGGERETKSEGACDWQALGHCRTGADGTGQGLRAADPGDTSLARH